jgi:uncharacterized Zn finger protein
MRCPRCRGLLVHETFGDLRQERARMSPATRCINCGCVEDSVVRANRLRHSRAPRLRLLEIAGKTREQWWS